MLFRDFFETFEAQNLLYGILVVVSVYHETVSANLLHLTLLDMPLQSLKPIPTPETPNPQTQHERRKTQINPPPHLIPRIVHHDVA